MGLMTEYDGPCSPQTEETLARLTEMMGGMVAGQTEIVRRLVAQPKSSGRVAWEAVHPSFGQLVADTIDAAGRILRGESPPSLELRRAGCRR